MMHLHLQNLNFLAGYAFFKAFCVLNTLITETFACFLTNLINIQQKLCSLLFRWFTSAYIEKKIFIHFFTEGFMFSWMLLSIFSKSLAFFIIRLAFRSWETSFVVISNLLRTSERTSILTKWLSAHPCLADIEFVKYENPVFWLAVSALAVCSNVKLIGSLEKSFLVLLIPKQAFLNSS